MINAIRTAAENYNEGMITADEFLGFVIEHIGNRWQRLKDTRVDHATRDTAKDVDALANILSKLEPM